MTNPTQPANPNHLQLLLSVTLVVMVLLIFTQTYSHEFVNFDDNTYITANPHIQKGFTLDSLTWAATTGHEGNWHPLTWLSHMLDYDLYGQAPMGHHLTNVFLHAVNTILLFLLLTKLTGATCRSFFVAALFAVHPLHVESVAWAAERKDVLCAFFWLIAMLLYVRYVERPNPVRYLALSAVFVLGLMCKSIIVALPLTLLVIDYWPLLRGANAAGRSVLPPQDNTPGRFSGHLLDKVPLLLLATVSAVLTFRMQAQAGSLNPVDLHNFLLNCGNAALSYVNYMAKMVWPVKLAVFYPFVAETVTVTKVLLATALLATVTVLALLWRRRYPYLLAGWLWYLLTLLPVIGILRIGRHALADRYTYMPLVGLFIVVVWGLADLFTALGLQKKTIAVFAGAIIAALMFTAFRQVGYWQNSYTLFRHAADVTVNNCITQNNLGEALFSKGQYDEAYPHIVEAIRIKPDFEVAFNNLGIINFKKGRVADAEGAFLTSLRLKPSYAIARYNLAVMYANLGKRGLARHEYRELSRTAPDLAAQLQAVLGVGLDRAAP